MYKYKSANDQFVMKSKQKIKFVTPNFHETYFINRTNRDENNDCFKSCTEITFEDFLPIMLYINNKIR